MFMIHVHVQCICMYVYMCVTCCRPMVVNERMICHAIIGKNPLKERIMTVDVTAAFIAPLLEFSSKKLLYSLYQVHVLVCCFFFFVYYFLHDNTYTVGTHVANS